MKTRFIDQMIHRACGMVTDFEVSKFCKVGLVNVIELVDFRLLRESLIQLLKESKMRVLEDDIGVKKVRLMNLWRHHPL